MKRAKNLYPQIVSFENLLSAAQKAEKAKRWQKNVWQFRLNQEKEIWQLKRELSTYTYCPGPYTAFRIFEPKVRMISAAPFRDRVVHHALCNVIGPILDRSMIFDTYANRKGKGTHKAVSRFQQFARKFPFALKADIRKFFPSIDHEILKQLIRRKIACPPTLALIDKIIDHSNPQEDANYYFDGDDLFTPYVRSKGLPIGNLTSQLMANYYLSPLDHFVKTQLGCKGYLRYVDDFVLFHDDKRVLHEWKRELVEFLESFRLQIHPNKSQVFPTAAGIGFLGHQLFPNYRLLKGENVRRFRKRTNRRIKAWQNGRLSHTKIEAQLCSWSGHASFSSTYHLQNKIFSQIEQQGICLKKVRRVAWRLLEQQR
ncbi:MAG: RNA-directed DNA polymerase [Bacteroidia bacterium]